ncbi:MAG TPA: hypothetical protein VI757_09425 [Bacteroidia bacterium]|nr:hypothetical protein [Bacteroidia bacterium]
MTKNDTTEVVDRFFINLKHEFTEIPHAASIPEHCKATTNEITWRHWMHESPQAEFFVRQIGGRIYYMMAEKHTLS